MTPMWTLDEALDLIRRIQPKLKPLGYHVCLGGGVLNIGSSEKDLDLFFVPLTNVDRPELDPLVFWMGGQWGTRYEGITDAIPCISLREQASYRWNDKRIDVFVV